VERESFFDQNHNEQEQGVEIEVGIVLEQ